MKINKLALALALSIPATIVPATSMAEVSANIGWVSEYIYRGIHQDDSSAAAGIDYAHDSGFYLGTWGADVGDGLETDVYFGFAGGENFTYKIGYTGYYYTDDYLASSLSRISPSVPPGLGARAGFLLTSP